MSAPVALRDDGALARITLDRPEALNALTEPMCQAMLAALLEWRDAEAIAAVLIEHEPGARGFCAGGDLRMLAADGDGAQAQAFFRTEYRLNHLLHAFPKPVIVLMDGVTMGGGVGLSVHARHRVATERTIWSMPETAIGLIPDVGAGYFLPRLPQELGMWIGLTGARLGPAECLALGLADHFLPSDGLDVLRVQLAEAAEARDPAQAIRRQLAALSEPPQRPDTLTAERRGQIELAFCQASVEAVLEALAVDGGTWAVETRETLVRRSPLALKATFRHLRDEGRSAASLGEVLAREYRIASRMVRLADFQAGVRAALIEKGRTAEWTPPRLADVDQSAVDALFAPVPLDEEWSAV